MRVTLVHNASAGDGNLTADELLALLRQAGCTPTYAKAKAPDLPELLRQPAELIAVAGGDGTVGKVATQLPDRSVPLTILPLGTANNIARTFKIGGEIGPLVDGWRGAVRRRLSVGTASGPWGRRRFVEATGVGAFAQAMAAIAGIEVPAGERAQRAHDIFRDTLGQARPLDAAVTVDGEAVDGNFLIVEAMNIAFAGSGIPFVPEADPGDDFLDVVLIEAAQRAAVLAWRDAPMATPLPGLVRRARKVTFDWHGQPLHLDDSFPEAPARPARVELALEPEPITILVPHRADGGGEQ
jgi:diacylglycerol kinase family enzyme